MAASTTSAPLNAEPSRPEERENQDLQPKSYVDAVREEAAEVADGINNHPSNNLSSTNIQNGMNGASESQRAKGGTTGTDKGASVLRIVNTHNIQDAANGCGERIVNKSGIANSSVHSEGNNSDSTNGIEQQSHETRPGIEPQGSKHEYSATGLDESPRSPPRHKHKMTTSETSDGARWPTTNGEGSLVFEKFQDQKNGVKLVSVKSAGNYEKDQVRSDNERLKRDVDNRTLVSGRQAGKRWETSGIRFAPMNVPLRRRLQTLVVLFHSTCIALSVSAFFFLCAIPIFWPLLIIYMIYCMSSNAATSGRLNYRSNFLRSSSIWSLFASYFPARLHRSEELPPTRKYIFGYHPHGIISHGAFAAFATEALGFSQLFPGITNTLLTLDSNFRIPIYRDYILAMGLGSVSRESCENLLSNGGKNNEGMGRAITIVIGGAAESLDAQPYFMRLVLKKRKGFVKMALRTGADLVPVLAFGENDLYDQVTSTSHPGIHKAQLLIKKLLGFTVPLFHARGVFNYDVGLMPYRRPLNIVVGRPIRVTRSLKPQQDEIDRLHEQYVRELESIWNSWKDDFAKDRKGELELPE